MDYYSNSSAGMSSRGRFSSRGGSSYRGGGRGESSYRGSRGSYSSTRGSYPSTYTSPRGRGSYYSKYESSGSKYSSEGSRYPSHTRMEETSYRKPESSSYRSSEHSHHRSEDMSRKRIRSDSYSQSQGTGSRRSHEVEEYRGGGSRYSNTNSYTESRSYSDNRSAFKKPRLSDIKPKEEYRGRKELSRSSVAVSKLRSIRGRTLRGRGIVRRGTDSFLSKKRVFSGSRGTSATELLALRKAKLLKQRRLKEKVRLSRLAEIESDKDKDKEEKSADEGEKEEKDDAQEEKEAGENEKEGEKEKKEEGENEESESKDKDRFKKEEDRIDFFGKPFMKLQCPVCSTKCITFKEYVSHLYQPTHVKGLRDKSIQLKSQLTKMRLAQRAKQKKTDEEDVSNLNTRTIFCPICKLNYSQDKSTHQSSEAHKKIKNFLQPYCKICRISYKSPVLYENHICSLDHIRRKNALDERLGKSKGASLDLDNFMVLDSVGSGDEGEENKEESKEDDLIKKEKEKEKEKEREKEAEEKVSDEDKLGVEFIRKVEAFYCEVCRIYLPRLMNKEKALRIHCRSKNHLKCYLRYGTEELLDQIQDKGDKKKSKSSGEKSSEKSTDDQEVTAKKESKNHDESLEDDSESQLWADVDNLLKEVEPATKSDDEDEEEGGRFDRFKSNEKKENGEVAGAEDANSEQDTTVAVTGESAEAEKKKET